MLDLNCGNAVMDQVRAGSAPQDWAASVLAIRSVDADIHADEERLEGEDKAHSFRSSVKAIVHA